MLNFKQFKVWKKVFDQDPELANRVLREYHKRIENMPTAEEAFAALVADDATVPMGFPTREEVLVTELIALA